MAAFLDRALDLPDRHHPQRLHRHRRHLPRQHRTPQEPPAITIGCSPTRSTAPTTPSPAARWPTFLDRALDLPTATTPSGFTDSAGTFFDNIDRLRAAGITVGCAPTLYCPDRAVTRAEMATFLMRALDLEELIPPPRPLPSHGNPDVDSRTDLVRRRTRGRVIARSRDRHRHAGQLHLVPQSWPRSRQGGVITFDCGPDPDHDRDAGDRKGGQRHRIPEIVIDGGGLVTLSGRGERRILYMNTCDPAQIWTTPHCQNQDHPRLTVQNLTFVDGNAIGDGIDLGGGGGAIWVRGGRFKIVNSRFFDNHCAPTGPDVAGGAVRVFSQYENLPVFVTGSTFGGDGHGQHVLERWRDEQHRRVDDVHQQPAHAQRSDRVGREPAAGRHPRRRQRRRDRQRRQHLHA